MKKYYKIEKTHYPVGFITVDLIEDDKTVGGYLLPDRGENTINISKYLEKEGYTEYEKADRIN